MPATRCAAGAATCAASTCSGRFQFGGRVEAEADGLLQLAGGQFGAWRSGYLWRVIAGGPLRIAAQVKDAAVAQFEADHAFLASHHLVAGKQAIAFDQQSARAFGGQGENLTDDAFNDGDDAAHNCSPFQLLIGFRVFAACWAREEAKPVLRWYLSQNQWLISFCY